MNLAFPALIILGLVLPGILLRYFYLRGFWPNSPFVITSVADEAAYGLFWAIVLNATWTWLLHICHVQVNFFAVFVLLTGSYGPNQSFLKGAIDAVANHPWQVASYFVSIYLIAIAVGLGAHWFVRKAKLDLRCGILRFSNDWYYLISGEILQFENASHHPRQVSAVYLSAVVKQGDTTFLYRGIVEHYYFDKTGNLERVVLTMAHRRNITNDRAIGEQRTPEFDDRYYDIVGDFFVIKYSDMQTINFEYIEVAPATEDSVAEIDRVESVVNPEPMTTNAPASEPDGNSEAGNAP